MRFRSIFGVLVVSFLAVSIGSGLSGCAMSILKADRSSEKYLGEQVTVVVRAGEQGIDEVEIHGLIGTQVITAAKAAIEPLPDGAFQVSLAKVAESIKDSGSPEVATLIRNRGIQKIVFDRVGDVALRARLDGNPDSTLILNRFAGREPASAPGPADFMIERYSPARF